MSRDTEIRYHLQVEPPVFTILGKVQKDSELFFNVSEDEFVRAVWSWSFDKLMAGGKTPEWMVQKIAQEQEKMEEGG